MPPHQTLRRRALRDVTRLLAGACAVGFVITAFTSAVPDAALAATNAGTATVVVPAGQTGEGTPLAAGGTDTDFTLELPAGAACTGDGVAGYRVNSFVVKSSTDPATITYDGNGPTTPGTGDTFRQPLWKSTKQRYVNGAPNAGDGVIINIPAFDFSVFNSTTRPSPGSYFLGIACTVGDAGPTQLDKYWVGQMTFIASGTDPRGVTWTSQAVAGTTTTTTTTTAPGGGGATTTTTTTPGGGGATTTTTSTSTSTPTTAAGGATTSTTRPTTTPTTSSVASGGLSRSGSNTTPMLVFAFLMLVLGRMAYLLGRPTSTKGS